MLSPSAFRKNSSLDADMTYNAHLLVCNRKYDIHDKNQELVCQVIHIGQA